MKRTKLLSGLLCAAMLLSLLGGCGPKTQGNDSSGSQSGSQSQQQEERTQVNLAVLSGPTGVGAAKLMYDNEQGTTKNDYGTVQVVAENPEIAALLANDQVDIAAIATNVAATYYNQNPGDIQMLAVNTLGVLYILEKGESVQSVADLRGKTIYATGQGANPEYILNKILTDNDLIPGQDVDIQWLTAQEVSAKVMSEEGAVAMLPVPAATAVLLKDQGVRQALDLSQEWENVTTGVLPMGCVVARTQFVEENPQAVADFMEEYEASIAYMSDPANAAREDEAANSAQLVAKYGITASADIAVAALPQCNLTFLTGEEMQMAVQNYYQILFQADPTSIGGQMPYDDFYYLP